MESNVSRGHTDTVNLKDGDRTAQQANSNSNSSSSESSSNSSETYSDNSVSESLGKPPPEPYNPTEKIKTANEKLNKVQNYLERTSKITWSEVNSQKSISGSLTDLDLSDEELDDEKKESNQETNHLEETQNNNNNNTDTSNSQPRSGSINSTTSTKSESNQGEVSEQLELAAELPPSVNSSITVGPKSQSQEGSRNSQTSLNSNSKRPAPKQAKLAKPVKQQKQTPKPKAPKQSTNQPIKSITVGRVRPASSQINRSKSPFKSKSSDRAMSATGSRTKKYAEDFSSDLDSDYSDSFDKNELSIQRSVRFSDKGSVGGRNSRAGTRSPLRATSSLSMAKSSVTEVKTTKASRLLAESISSRPASPAPKKGEAGRELWTEGEAPGNADQLPNYMRPKTADSTKARRKATPSRSSYGIDMKTHFENLGKEYPNVKSNYQMPKEQRELMERRQKVKAKRIREKQELERETERADQQAAHEVWTAWYETSIDEAKEKKRTQYQDKKAEKQRLQEDQDRRKADLKEKKVDPKSWWRNKLLTKRQEDRETRRIRVEEAQSVPGPVQKIRMNDRAFRDWCRKVSKREKEALEMEKIRSKLRNVEMRKELRAQKALQSIRAAQEEAMTFKNFVF